MSNIYKDLIYYKSLFPDSDLSVKEQSATMNWSERKCYVYKFFISTLSESEVEVLKNSTIELEYELIGAISIHSSEMRMLMLDQLERIQKSESPFEEIEMIANENTDPNPLNSTRKDYWIAVKNYLTDREYDEYPFDMKSRSFLMSVARIGYANLSTAQLRYINGLIDKDRDRSTTDQFFVNDYLVRQGFEIECKAIAKIWANR